MKKLIAAVAMALLLSANVSAGSLVSILDRWPGDPFGEE